MPAVLESLDFISSHFLLSYFLLVVKSKYDSRWTGVWPNKEAKRRRKGSSLVLLGNSPLIGSLLGKFNILFIILKKLAQATQIRISWKHWLCSWFILYLHLLLQLHYFQHSLQINLGF